jgi:hypothetical protein
MEKPAPNLKWGLERGSQPTTSKSMSEVWSTPGWSCMDFGKRRRRGESKEKTGRKWLTVEKRVWECCHWVRGHWVNKLLLATIRNIEGLWCSWQFSSSTCAIQKKILKSQGTISKCQSCCSLENSAKSLCVFEFCTSFFEKNVKEVFHFYSW